jgi:hypothetical protein
MKYSLRSLMIVVTLACVILGGRIEYLRRWAVFHESEARRCTMQFEKDTADEFFSSSSQSVFFQPPSGLALEQGRAHEELAREYRLALYRPWTTIKAPLPPADEAEMLKRMDYRE